MAISGLMMALALLGAQRSPQETPDALPDIVVRGASGDPVGRFVGGVTVPGEHGRFEGQVARWGDSLCVSVTGATPEVNAYLTEQITANFKSLDVPHQGPNCEPTVAVVVSREADAFAQVYADRARVRLFDNRREAIARFVGPSRPVRWRHAVVTGALGADPSRHPVAAERGQAVARLPGSRLRVATARAVTRAIIVVDADRASTAPLDALAAYLAFVTLVDLPSEPTTGAQRTILTLFDESAGPDRARALTRWDRAFITALYGMAADRTFSFQQAEIESRMRRVLEAPTP